MLPLKESNIYPKTEENLKALFSFYFDEYDLPGGTAVEDCMAKTSLSLNQIEYIVRKLSESYNSLFKKFFSFQPTVSLLLMYGFNALTKKEEEWPFGPYSGARPKLREFIEFVKQSENGQ